MTPRSISLIAVAVTNWWTTDTDADQCSTDGLRPRTRSADTTLVSRRYLTAPRPLRAAGESQLSGAGCQAEPFGLEVDVGAFVTCQ